MRRVVIGVTGGIAAFRACDLIGRLRELNVATRVAMTPNATRFVTPLTFAALSGHEVLVDELAGAGRDEIPHIAWARWAELVAIVPATADFVGRVAHGLGDDSLTCLLLALERAVPVLFAPAMNVAMWENPLVQQNVARLAAIDGFRYQFIAPATKRLACGETGAGGLPPVERIAERIVATLRGDVAAAP